MEASDLTILLFFTIVVLVLLAFFLWLYISHRTTPPSQRLTLWLKSQSEADQLVETMVAQTECILDGLRLCGHRNSRKRQRIRQRAAVAAEAAAAAAAVAAATTTTSAAVLDPVTGLNGTAERRDGDRFWSQRLHLHQQKSTSTTQSPPPSSRHSQRPIEGQSETKTVGITSVTIKPNNCGNDPEMDEIWRKQHQHRWRDESNTKGLATTFAGGRSSHGGGGTGYKESQQQQQQAVQQVDLEAMAEERTWEYVVGWCLIGCIFAGIAIIIGAGIKVQNDPGHEETHWSFSQGDSLMDSVISHIMKVAAGAHDFEDQWMEQGIFVFVLGINGYLLIRQRVFARRRQYEASLLQTMPSPTFGRMRKNTATVKGKEGLDHEEDDEAERSEGIKIDKDLCDEERMAHYLDRGFDRYPEHLSRSSTLTPISTTTDQVGRSGANSRDPGNAKSGNSENESNIAEDDLGDLTPDFRTMSFMAWFNYLQIGILVIEFLQLFSFPLRELMDFYNQAAKTSAMYESAKGILNAIQSASLTVKDMANQGIHGFRYQNGTLSFGNSPLFRFGGSSLSQENKNSHKESGNNDQSGSDTLEEEDGNLSPESMDVHQQRLDEGGDSVRVMNLEEDSTIKLATAILNNTMTSNTNLTHLDDWKSKMPKIDDATPYVTPWIKNLTDSAERITQNMPRLLPNISALLFNTTTLQDIEHSLGDIKDAVVNVTGFSLHGALGNITNIVNSLTQAGLQNSTEGNLFLPSTNNTSQPISSGKAQAKADDDIVLQVVNGLGLQPSINTHDWYLLRLWSCVAVVVFGWFITIFIHTWNRQSRARLRAGKSYWPPISVGWISCFIPVVSVLYLPILSTFLSSAACQSQAIHAYAHEKFEKMDEQARASGQPNNRQHQVSGESVLNQFILALLDPASTVSHPATSLLCTGPNVQPPLYMAVSLLAYMLAHLLFMVFLTSFERQPVKGEICFRPNGVAILKNLGLLLAVDFLLIQAPSQRRFRGLVSIAIMLAMACYTIKMKPCYWNKLNYWRTFSFSCVLYASLLVALLCPSPILDKVKGERIGGRWTMAPNLDMGHAWLISGGPKVILAWIATGWVLLIIVFVVAERIFLQPWTRKKRLEREWKQIQEEEEERQRQIQMQHILLQGDQNWHCGDVGRGRGEEADASTINGRDVIPGEGVGVGTISSLCAAQANRADHHDQQHATESMQCQQPSPCHGYPLSHTQPWNSHGSIAFPTYQPQTPQQRQTIAATPSQWAATGSTVERIYQTDDVVYSPWREKTLRRYQANDIQDQNIQQGSDETPLVSTPNGSPYRTRTVTEPISFSRWASPMTEAQAARSHWSIVDLDCNRRAIHH